MSQPENSGLGEARFGGVTQSPTPKSVPANHSKAALAHNNEEDRCESQGQAAVGRAEFPTEADRSSNSSPSPCQLCDFGQGSPLSEP